MTRLLALAILAALAVWLARRDRAVPARPGWWEARNEPTLTWSATGEQWGSV